MDQHIPDAFAAQHLLASMSDDPPNRPHKSPMARLMDACERARREQLYGDTGDGGFNAMTAKF